MYFKKAKPETIQKRKEEYKEQFSEQIEWFEENMNLIKGNTFLVDMYSILVTGSRPVSQKMLSSINAAMVNWRYNPKMRAEKEAKMKPIIEKINVLKDMVEAVDGNRVNTRYSAYSFVQSLLDQAQSRLSLSEKQMSALIKCYKKYNLKFETLFKENKNDSDN